MAKKTNPTRQEFTLKKVKLSDGKVHIEGNIQENSGSSIVVDNIIIDRPVIAHPDFIRAIDKLRPIALKALGFLDFKSVLSNDTFATEERKAVKTIDKYFSRLENHCNERMQVTGIAISGEDKTLGVIITTKYNPIGKMKCAMNTPKIMLNSDVFKTESEISAIVDEIHEEVYCYLYEGKQAQPELLAEIDTRQMEIGEEETEQVEE